MSDSVMGDGEGAIPSPKKYVNPQMLARAMAGIMMADIDVTGASRPIATDEQYRAMAEKLIHHVIGPERISAVLATWAEDAASSVIEGLPHDKKSELSALPLGSVVAAAQVVYLRDSVDPDSWKQMSHTRNQVRTMNSFAVAQNHPEPITVLREGWGE